MKRPLTCRRCSSTGDRLTVAGAGNTRIVRGKKRRAQHVRCQCGHEWVSVHAEALARGREADRAHRAGSA